MSEAEYKVGDIVDVKESTGLNMHGMPTKNRTVVAVNLTGDGIRYILNDDPEPWNGYWIKGLSVFFAPAQDSVVAQDRVKLKFNRKTGTVLSPVEFGTNKGKVIVMWDKTETVEAVDPKHLVVLHSPTATVEVDEELVARLNEERQRLIRIMEATKQELVPLTQRWKQAKAGKVVDNAPKSL